MADSSLTLTTTGTYLIQFRAVDAAGNMSAWAPASTGPAATACISRQFPLDRAATAS